MRMLAALSCVDWAVPFSEDTPERFYCCALPDILVNGGDYIEERVSRAGCVKRADGEVQIIEFLDSLSTTVLISKIKESGGAGH
jgi:D-beta-D-heptose 7-phosphate kinase/D-beta-D-heptose 1-phosphate adenosyltransferase